jgi:membrane protein YdbS with pleckstrin-like domain
MRMHTTRFIGSEYYTQGIVFPLLAVIILMFSPIKKYGNVDQSISGLSIDLVAGIIFLVIALLSFIAAEMKRIMTLYTITDNKIIRRDGILRGNTQMIPYTQLNRIDLDQSFAQRMMKIGTLVIDTGDDTLKIQMISHPEMVQEMLSHRIGRLSYAQQPQPR